jgi:hypothetical protein
MALKVVPSPKPKDRPLLARLSRTALRFLQHLADEGSLPELPEKRETVFPQPYLRSAVVDLLMERKEAYASILQKHLESGGPLGRAEYLYLAYQIQQQAYHANQISRRRFIELTRLHQELFRLFHSRFSDERYLLGNLNAYAACAGINNEVPAALERILAMAEKKPAGERFSPDLMTRNLIAMLEKSEEINEVAFSNTLSRYADTLVTLAARALYKDETGPVERFERFLDQPVSLVEKGDWYRLHVMSNPSGFWAVLELDRIVIPLGYRYFSSLTSGRDLVRLNRQEGQSETYIMYLPQGTHLHLSAGEVGVLDDACARIRSSPEYQSHDRIWSLLHGTAE